jgi:hypothetical protein
MHIPMYISEFMDGFNGKDALCHVESGNVFRENIILHQHGHEIASRKKLHDEVEINRVLERVE